MPIELWRSAQHGDHFQSAYVKIAAHTLVEQVRCYVLWHLCKHARGVKGDAAEVGVYKGGTAKLMQIALERSAKDLFLFDTFNGIPHSNSQVDKHKKGDFADSDIGEVRAFLGNVVGTRLIEGTFPDSAIAIQGRRQFSIVHVDVDVHQSVIACCEYFYPRMTPAGVMVFDDYGFAQCAGARKAVDEFFVGRRSTPIYLPTGQAIVIKT